MIWGSVCFHVCVFWVGFLLLLFWFLPADCLSSVEIKGVCQHAWLNERKKNNNFTGYSLRKSGFSSMERLGSERENEEESSVTLHA